jgi:hypothetical protein
MAVYFLRIHVLSRAKGACVTRAAAYRAGERIRDERTSAVHNFSSRQDVAHKEIVLPSNLADSPDVGWARDRSTLWNAVEHAGRRRNARLAREALVTLPPELTPAQRTNLVRTFSRELADKYQSAVDFAVHEPRRGSDERHHHAHILMTARQVTPEGPGPRTTLELSGTDRHARGLGPSKGDLLWIRERWAQVTNEALRDAGLTARIDHRSYKDQGIDREPAAVIPQKVFYAEKKYGMSTRAGDNIRARRRERVEARLKGGDELARVLQRQKEVARQRAIESSKQKEGLPKRISQRALTREELNQKRRERYRQNGEGVRQKRTAWRRANAAEINERRREWNRAHAEEVNRKQRENYRVRVAQRMSKRPLTAQERQLVKARAAQESAPRKRNKVLVGQLPPSTTAEESVKSWLALSESQKQSTTAEESVKNWLALSESQKQGTTAEESVRNWLALSESQGQADPSHIPSQNRSHAHEVDGEGTNDDKNTDRGRDYDTGL